MKAMRGAALVLALSAGGVAFAGPLAPGQTGNTREEDGIYPAPPPSAYQGALLAQRSEPFRFETVDQGQTQFIEGLFSSRVYRDAGTGGLAFVYELDETSRQGIVDLESVVMSGFRAFPLDVYTTSDNFAVTRSADGDQLSWTFDQEGIEDIFLVRAAPGMLIHSLGAFRLGIDFEPSGNAGNRTFQAFVPIPEPSSGAVALVAAAGLLRRRRRKA